jgi:hypothetical protein
MSKEFLDSLSFFELFKLLNKATGRCLQEYSLFLVLL